MQARLADTKAAQEASMEYGWWEGRKEEEETTLLHRPLENRFFNYLGLGRDRPNKLDVWISQIWPN